MGRVCAGWPTPPANRRGTSLPSPTGLNHPAIPLLRRPPRLTHFQSGAKSIHQNLSTPGLAHRLEAHGRQPKELDSRRAALQTNGLPQQEQRSRGEATLDCGRLPGCDRPSGSLRLAVSAALRLLPLSRGQLAGRTLAAPAALVSRRVAEFDFGAAGAIAGPSPAASCPGRRRQRAAAVQGADGAQFPRRRPQREHSSCLGSEPSLVDAYGLEADATWLRSSLSQLESPEVSAGQRAREALPPQATARTDQAVPTG